MEYLQARVTQENNPVQGRDRPPPPLPGCQWLGTARAGGELGLSTKAGKRWSNSWVCQLDFPQLVVFKEI